MKKFILVYNPNSGDKSFKYNLDFVIKKFQEKDAIIIPYRTTSKDGTRKFIMGLKNEDIAGIIASGGDGTVHEIINSILMAEIDVPIGIVPSGTSNDFARYLGIDTDFVKALDIVLDGKTKYIDVGKVNDKYFFNVASAGLLTSVAHNIDPVFKSTLGKMAYYIKGLGELQNIKSIKMKITADETVIEDEVMLFLVMNSRTTGGFPNLAPHARTDDGKLDLIVVTKWNMAEQMSLMLSLLKGDHLNHNNIKYLQAKKIFIENKSGEDVESDLDGELGPYLPLEIETISNKVKVFYRG